MYFQAFFKCIIMNYCSYQNLIIGINRFHRHVWCGGACVKLFSLFH